jgi:hypothetical protein
MSNDTSRQSGDPHDSDEALGKKRVHGGIPTGTPQQPIPEESQFMPDTGDRPPSPTGRSEGDLMDEAQDGFMDRYPPKGQTNE